MKFTEEHERTLLDAQADPVDRASAISCMRADGVQRHETLLVSFLDHPSPHLRGESIAALLAWGRREFLSIAYDEMANEDEPGIRVMMASSLASWAMTHPRDKRESLARLAERMRIDPDEWVVERIYVRVRMVLELPRLRSRDDFDRERDVDWAALAPYLDAPPAPAPKN